MWLSACSCESPSLPDGSGFSDAAIELDAGQLDASVAVDAGSSDAGRMDAGFDAGVERDAGPPDPEDASVVLTATTDDLAVHLAWVADYEVLGWYVVRNGAVIRTIDPTARSFDDLTAPAGSLGSFDASASIGMPSGVEIDWTTPPSSIGAAQQYEVIAQLMMRTVTSNSIDAGRGAPRVVRWVVTRGDAGWSVMGDEEFLLDPTAPSPNVNVTGLVSRAVPDDYSTSVAVIADASVSWVPQDVNYLVAAEPSAGVPPPSVTVSGSRGGNRVRYQWQRSSDDSPDAFVDLQYVHGSTWADMDAVMGEGRFYRVVAISGSQRWESPATRAFLKRPKEMHGEPQYAPNVFFEDGSALLLERGFTPVWSFFDAPNVVQYFTHESRPCALYADGGAECGTIAGPPRVVPLPASTGIVVGDSVLCGRDLVGAAHCVAFSNFSPFDGFDATGLLKFTSVSRAFLCGHLDDGGTRCVSRDAGAAAIETGTAHAWAWSTFGVDEVFT